MKTITDLFVPYIGTREYNGIVETMIRWYYGGFTKVAWCAISCSYMANQLGILDQFGGKNDNVYNLMKGCEKARPKQLTYAKKLEKGTVIRRGTVLFLLKSDPPMTATSKKHVTTAYEDFTYTGKGYIKTLGGNQSDYIRVAQYPQSQIYAIFEPDYTKHSTLRQGDKGQEVRELQMDLNYLGYRDDKMRQLKVDGSFGPITLSVVKKFQADQNLQVDGVVGSKSWTRLLTMMQVRFLVTTKTRLNLRKTPEKTDNKIKVLQADKKFYCSRWTKEWAYLPDEGGWVMNQYLER